MNELMDSLYSLASIKQPISEKKDTEFKPSFALLRNWQGQRARWVNTYKRKVWGVKKLGSGLKIGIILNLAYT